MKVFWGALLLVTMSFSANAQVKDTLNQKMNQDLMKFKKLKRAGCILFATGIPLTIIGGVMLDNSPEECDPDAPGKKCHYTEVNGVGLLVGGMIISSAGMGLWTLTKKDELIYKFRHRQKKYTLAVSTSLNGIGIRINF